jgi:hypothetical protein
LKEKTLKLESQLLMMISQDKSISKRPRMFKLMLVKNLLPLSLREEMEVMELLLLTSKLLT